MTKMPSIWTRTETVAPLAPETQASAASADNALSLIFDDLSLELQTASDDLCAVRAAAYRTALRPAGSAPVVGYLQDVALGIEKSPGARVLIVADLGGTPYTVEFPFGPAPDVAIGTRRFFSPIGVDLASAVGSGLTEPPPYEASFLLAIQRRTAEDFALVSIDTLDVVAIMGPEPAS